MLLLASNTAFASNPDSSFDTLINLTTTLATQGYKPDVWKKHIQGFVDRRAISGASKGVFDTFSENERALESLVHMLRCGGHESRLVRLTDHFLQKLGYGMGDVSAIGLCNLLSSLTPFV